MSLSERTRALLDVVEHERERQCGALLGEAERAARQQRESSRGEARRRLHEAFAEERARTEAGLAAARADLRTRQRAHAQRHLEALLALAWQRLPQALVARWQAAASRRAWLAATCADAARVLPTTGPWQVAHAAGLDDDDRAACMAHAAAARFTGDGQIGAGVRISAGGNVLDATLQGLLADRAEVGGRLVGALQAPGPSLPATDAMPSTGPASAADAAQAPAATAAAP